MMSRLRTFLVALAAVALVAGPLGVPAQAGASGGASVSASAQAKKKCKKFKGKKKRQCLKNASKGGTGGKPWAGSPYRPGITCSLSSEMGKKYARYGLFCLDLGFGITTLEPL
jgi:hypothetical protein